MIQSFADKDTERLWKLRQLGYTQTLDELRIPRETGSRR